MPSNSALNLTSLVFARTYAITRERGEYIVCVSVMGTVIDRTAKATREDAYTRISELKNGGAL